MHMLLCKLTASLHKMVLKSKVFQKCVQFKDVEGLLMWYLWLLRDAHGCKNERQPAVAATDIMADITEAENAIVAASAMKPNP